jgi:DNA (cytosine-5)-methyltransferase 1
VLENVVGYRRSQSLTRIIATLSRLGYFYQLTNCNAADFGVPQTRRRLILRAVRGGLVPHFPRKVRWVGWYAAIADLIPTLPESAFAPWQLARLGAIADSVLVHPTEMRSEGAVSALEPAFTVTGTHGIPRAFLVGTNGEHGDLCRGADSPAQTIAATHGAEKHRAFLIGGGNTQLTQVDSKPRWDDAPAFTVAGNESATTNQRAWLVSGQSVEGGIPALRRGDEPSPTTGTNAANCRAWLEQGRVVAMTPRALARFQSVPDSYVLPESRTLACTVIGNGVPVLLAKAIGVSLIGAA